MSERTESNTTAVKDKAYVASKPGTKPGMTHVDPHQNLDFMRPTPHDFRFNVSSGVPFIDVGMGVEQESEGEAVLLSGTCRVSRRFL